MEAEYYSISIRPLLWALGALGVGIWFLRRDFWDRFLRSDLKDYRRYSFFTWTLATFFLALATLSKLSQWNSFQLHALDFWLFEDLTRSLIEGKGMVTRFAPQAVGWVQHGGVHPTWVWYLTVVLAKISQIFEGFIASPTLGALLFGPLSLALASRVVSQIGFELGGPRVGWALQVAFLISSPVARVLEYDTHPEQAYPLALLGLGWALGVHQSPNMRRIWAVFFLILTLSIKEDAFLYALPLVVGVAFYRAKKRSDFQFLMGFILVLVVGSAAQFYAMNAFRSGLWGVQIWGEFPIARVVGSGAVQAGESSLLGSLTTLLGRVGGVSGALYSVVRFWFSRPWLSLMVFVPSLALSLRFLMWALPGAAVHAGLGGPASHLQLYYVAPFLAFVFLGVQGGRNRVVWTLLAATLVGGGSLKLFVPRPGVNAIRQELIQWSHCIELLELNPFGIVQGPYLGEIRRERVLSDRVPEGPSQQWDSRIRFVLQSRSAASFAYDPGDVRGRLSVDANWQEFNLECRMVQDRSPNLQGKLQLFVRKR